MANDRILGQVKTKKLPSKWDYWLIFGGNCLISAVCAVILFMMPWINSFEDETTAKLSETVTGRWQMSLSSIVPLLIFALIPAAMSYGFCRLNGITGGRPLKLNRAFKIARTVYFVLVFWGVFGAITFIMGRTPLNGFGF